MEPSDVLTKRSRNSLRTRPLPHFVYQLWSDEECLYVGMSMRLSQRLAAHERKPWWSKVTSVRAEVCFDKAEAQAEEAAAIAEHQPRHNVNHTDFPRERRRSS